MENANPRLITPLENAAAFTELTFIRRSRSVGGGQARFQAFISQIWFFHYFPLYKENPMHDVLINKFNKGPNADLIC